jgi:hypothetical protein
LLRETTESVLAFEKFERRHREDTCRDVSTALHGTPTKRKLGAEGTSDAQTPKKSFSLELELPDEHSADNQNGQSASSTAQMGTAGTNDMPTEAKMDEADAVKKLSKELRSTIALFIST